MFITGGTGFVGTWLLALLARAEARLELRTDITVLTRTPRVFADAHPGIVREGHVRFAVGDVRDFEAPSGAFTAVIHGAASSDDAWTRAHPAEAIDTIVTGTRRMLDFGRRCAARRFLLLSSGAVYGRQPDTMRAVPEDYEGAPVVAGDGAAAYGEAKRVAEVLTRVAGAEGLPAVSARIFSCYGPFLPLSSHFAVGNFVADAAAGTDSHGQGRRKAVRTYIYGGANTLPWAFLLVSWGVVPATRTTSAASSRSPCRNWRPSSHTPRTPRSACGCWGRMSAAGASYPTPHVRARNSAFVLRFRWKRGSQRC